MAAWANNGWLQELPKPQTKTTWDNLIYIRPSDAEKMGVHKGDLLTVTVKDKSVTGPVWITPNQAQGSVAVFFGYGRTASGRVGNKNRLQRVRNSGCGHAVHSGWLGS